MKRSLILISFITLAIISFNCERDDICAETTATTPRLIIEFYDADDLEVLKNVPRITVYGDGLVTDEDGTSIEPTESSDATLLYNENANTVELPLMIGTEGETNTVRYIFEKDTNLRVDETGDSNIDVLEISYKTDFIYVSRACGYKSIFTELSISREPDDAEPWIANIIIEESIENTVENENTTHVRIYH
ncbi:DUF6452 family protein [Winogradskyella schleiferi]|uniref:DUF6452 family protein n=1 Tax=Winogradskyella schleiferi TaxID=2686078 RepID=UPI0015BC18B5|nr:DUF6452 family protein [Winogradskyella schleiferi]